MRGQFGAVAEADLDFVRAVDHVAVGQDVTFLANDHAGALAVEDRTFLRFVVGLSLLFLLLASFLEPFSKFLRHLVEIGPQRVVAVFEAEVRRLVGNADDDDGGRNLVGQLDEGLVQLPGEFEGRGGLLGAQWRRHQKGGGRAEAQRENDAITAHRVSV